MPGAVHAAREFKQDSRVPTRVANGLERNRVAREFRELGDVPRNPPDQRMKPEHALDSSPQREDERVSSANVCEFMRQDSPPRLRFPGAPTDRQNDGWTQYSRRDRRDYVV